ncbi:MAG: non-histone chromosomal MC1 family protein [Candidatus Woesearchaeota archaeon]
MAKGMRYFVLQENERDSAHVFTGRQPRQAALKAASRGFSSIILRERGSKKLHIYSGERVKVSAPDNKPDWMPDTIWRAKVNKKGIRHL